MKKNQSGLVLICANSDEELSQLALSTIVSQLESLSKIAIVSKKGQFTEADLNQLKVKNDSCIFYHFSFDELNTEEAHRVVYEVLRLSPRAIYFDDFDYGKGLDAIISVARASHLIFLGKRGSSPSEAIEQLSSKISNRHFLEASFNSVIAPNYKEEKSLHSLKLNACLE